MMSRRSIRLNFKNKFFAVLVIILAANLLDKVLPSSRVEPAADRLTVPAKIAPVEQKTEKADQKAVPAEVSQDTAKIENPATFEEKHADRAVLFLLMKTEIEVREDWTYSTKMHKKIKIQRNNARYLGEVTIPYEKGMEKIIDLKAHTITPDGEKYSYSKMQDMKRYKEYPIYSDEMLKVITMPRVNVGNIIEYSYSIEAKGMPIKNVFYTYLPVDFGVPIKDITIKITMPKSLGIQYRSFNLDYGPEVTETEDTITYLWHRENVDAEDEEEEKYTPPPTPESCKNSVEFSSIKNWSDVSDWYYSLILKNTEVTADMEKAVKSITEGLSDQKDKIRAVLEYMHENFRYVSMSFGENALEPHPTSEVFRTRYGDCKDLSLLVKTLLALAGINSDLALFNDEDEISDPQEDLPIPVFFDHVLLLVHDPEGDYYIDPLLKGYDIGEYPMSYQRAYTFIINSDGGKHDRLPEFNDERNFKEKKSIITINPDGSAIFKTNVLWDLDFSIELRKEMNNGSVKEIDDFIKEINSKYDEVFERSWGGFDEKYGCIESHIKYLKKNAYTATGEEIIINMPTEDSIPDLMKEKRKNPVFCHINSVDDIMAQYDVPKGWHVSQLPADLDIDSGILAIQRVYGYDRKENRFFTAERIRYRRTQIPTEEYPKVRDFFKTLEDKTRQRVILKKDGFFDKIKRALYVFFTSDLEIIVKSFRGQPLK